jgi:CHAT domain-containing protein
MRLFYHKLWVEKKSPATALREAQLEILRHPEQTELLATTRGPRFEETVKLTESQQRSGTRQSASPRLWAAFTLSGDWQ